MVDGLKGPNLIYLNLFGGFRTLDDPCKCWLPYLWKIFNQILVVTEETKKHPPPSGIQPHE